MWITALQAGEFFFEFLDPGQGVVPVLGGFRQFGQGLEGRGLGVLGPFGQRLTLFAQVDFLAAWPKDGPQQILDAARPAPDDVLQFAFFPAGKLWLGQEFQQFLPGFVDEVLIEMFVEIVDIDQCQQAL